MLVKLPLLTKIVYHINLIKTGLKPRQAKMCGSRKYPYHPQGRDRIFQGGREGSICLSFQWGGGGAP